MKRPKNIGNVKEVFDVKNNIKELYYKQSSNPYKMKSSINYKENRRYNFTGQFSSKFKHNFLKTNSTNN